MSNALTLYEVEERYLALLDTEAMVTPEQEAEFQQELAASLNGAMAKRDRAVQFIRVCETQIDAINDEINRLEQRWTAISNGLERFKSYVVRIIEEQGIDERTRKYKTFRGSTSELSLRSNPASVEITDADKIPATYKTVTPTTVISIDKRALASELKSGNVIPGADLKPGKNRLHIK